jgi:peptidoglycan/xylan/chitin deacetylase (PgdA/CDA1 family)
VRLAALSVDLDEIPCYAAIHGLRVPSGSEHAIYDHAVARLEALFASEGIPATFFAIGSDLAREENRATLKRLHDAGHEIASHSESHLYDLTRRDDATIEREIARAEASIEGAVGERPVGFRAPGYTITDAVLGHLTQRGYLYDSSVFPCLAYYAAKAAAISAIALAGRQSRSIVDHPRVLRAPADPYRIGARYPERGAGLLELPIGVTRGARLPYIGTSVTAGTLAARALTAQMIGRPLVNLELHGIDLSDARGDGLTWLAPHQLDLRRTAADKERALRAAIGALRRAGYAFVTLREAACSLGAAPRR